MKLVILPGWQQNSEHWQTVKNILTEQGHDVEIIDLPGFGQEPYVNGIETITDVADWLESKLANLTSKSDYMLIGHSFGGRVAATLAARQPTNLKAVVLNGSPNLYHTDFRTKIKKTLSKLLGIAKPFLPENFKANLRSADYQAVRGTELETLFKNIIGENQTVLLRNIQIPIYLLWGKNDPQVPISVAYAIEKIIPSVKVDIINDAGHDLHLEKPQLLAAKLKSYVENIKVS